MADETLPEVPPEEISEEEVHTAPETPDSGLESDSATGLASQVEEDFDMPEGSLIINHEPIPHNPGELPEEPAEDEPVFTAAAYELPSPVLATESKPPAQNEALPADPEMVKLLISDDDLKTLWARAEQVRVDINRDINTLPIGRQMLDLIQSGQNELLAGREHYEEAARFVNEVEYRIKLISLVKKWSKEWGWLLFLYLLVLGVAAIGILAFVLGGAAFATGRELTTTYQLKPDLIYLFTTVVWAGFGGVLGGLLSLVRHIAQDQDFDKQHAIWYFGSPWVGAAVGAAVYLFLRAGLLSLMNSSADIQSPIVIYVVGFLAGYRHNVFTDLVRRILNTFEPSQSEKEVPPPEPRTKVEIVETIQEAGKPEG